MTIFRALFLATLLLPFSAAADRSDREKAVNMEADRVSVDDPNRVLVFEGNVQLTQGTMSIRASRLVVTQDSAGFQKGVAYGSSGAPARFKQKREGREDFIEGEAERIEHDGRGEKTEFFVNARVKSGGDEVAGHYIAFDSVTERYVVTGGASDPKTGVGPNARVRAVIQPKSADAGKNGK